ncbi:hypothetical protein Avbf_06797, partial [Armadillidium vulgare]
MKNYLKSCINSRAKYRHAVLVVDLEIVRNYVVIRVWNNHNTGNNWYMDPHKSGALNQPPPAHNMSGPPQHPPPHGLPMGQPMAPRAPQPGYMPPRAHTGSVPMPLKSSTQTTATVLGPKQPHPGGSSSPKPPPAASTPPQEKVVMGGSPKPVSTATNVSTSAPIGTNKSAGETKKISNTPSEGERRSKRSRNPATVYQSPVPDSLTRLTKSLISTPKTPQDKLVIFFKNEHVALRNAEGTFYLCQIVQNVYKSTRKIKIRWLSPLEDKEECELYKPDYYDITDFDCILTSVALQKSDKRMDLSLYNDESQLKKRKRRSRGRPKQRGESSEESETDSEEE